MELIRPQSELTDFQREMRNGIYGIIPLKAHIYGALATMSHSNLEQNDYVTLKQTIMINKYLDPISVS